MDWKSFKNTIDNAESVIIFSHVNPDGDTLGAMTALNIILKKYFNKKEVVMFSPDRIPEIYTFLPNSSDIKTLNDIKKDFVFDLAIAVDIAAKDRMREGLSVFNNAKTTINIDHHKTNTNYANLNFVKGGVSCAGEVLFDLIEPFDFDLDKDIADALYTSFLTDTGGFKYESTTSETLEKASKLVKAGASPADIARCCYDSKPKAMVMLRSYCISNAKFSNDNKIAYVSISQKDMDKFNAKNEHTEGLVESLRQINTVNVAFVVKEVDENTTKVSLRSKNIDVSEIAAVFDGGGHKFAAGCTIRKPLKIACDKLLEEVRKRI